MRSRAVPADALPLRPAAQLAVGVLAAAGLPVLALHGVLDAVGTKRSCHARHGRGRRRAAAGSQGCRHGSGRCPCAPLAVLTRAFVEALNHSRPSSYRESTFPDPPLSLPPFRQDQLVETSDPVVPRAAVPMAVRPVHFRRPRRVIPPLTRTSLRSLFHAPSSFLSSCEDVPSSSWHVF